MSQIVDNPAIPLQRLPKVSVVMSVYNGGSYVEEAMNSILGQTFTDFELILIDDGSTDRTPAIIASFSDPRIVRINHPTNVGLVTALREGVERARGELIARMDADDISLPERFAKQVVFFDTHPEVGVLGTAMRQVNSAGQLLAIISPPTDHALIEWSSLFESTVMHPTVMMRRSVVLQAGNYNPDYIHVEDTELWSRMILITRFANLSEPLCIRRWRVGSISYQKSSLQQQRSAEIRLQLLQKILGRELPKNLATTYIRAWANPAAALSIDTVSQVILLLSEANQKLIAANQSAPNLSAIAQQLQTDLAHRIITLSQRDSRLITKLIYRWFRTHTPYTVKNWINRLLAQRHSS